jgi:hypothetical protein
MGKKGCSRWKQADFLGEVYSNSGIYLSIKQFNTALTDAYKRGVIGKSSRGRFIPI